MGGSQGLMPDGQSKRMAAAAAGSQTRLGVRAPNLGPRPAPGASQQSKIETCHAVAVATRAASRLPPRHGRRGRRFQSPGYTCLFVLRGLFPARETVKRTWGEIAQARAQRPRGRGPPGTDGVARAPADGPTPPPKQNRMY